MPEAKFSAEERQALMRDLKGDDAKDDAAAKKAGRAAARAEAKRKAAARLAMQKERQAAKKEAEALARAKEEMEGGTATPPWEQEKPPPAEEAALMERARKKVRKLGGARITVHFVAQGTKPAVRTFKSIAQMATALATLHKLKRSGAGAALLDCDDGMVRMIADFSHIEVNGATAEMLRSAPTSGARNLIVIR